MKIVFDSCSLIYIAKTNLIDIFEKLGYKCFIDTEVYDEVVVSGKSEGYTDAYYIDYVINKKKIIKVVEVNTSSELDYFIGRGETSTYILSKKLGAIAVTSDKNAYNKFLNRNTKVVQTDMLFFNEFKKGAISKKEFERILRLLLTVGGTTPKRVLYLMSKIQEETH